MKCAGNFLKNRIFKNSLKILKRYVKLIIIIEQLNTSDDDNFRHSIQLEGRRSKSE